MSGAQIMSTIIVAPLGNFAIAANSFAVTAESLCYMPGYGIGDAATTLVGQSMGAGRKDLCRSLSYMTVGLGMGVMALMGVIMYVFAPEMIGILTPVEEIRQLGITSLRIEAFAEPFFGAAIITYCICVGAGDNYTSHAYQSRLHVADAPHACRIVGSPLWTARRMVCHGRGADLQGLSLPVAALQGEVDGARPAHREDPLELPRMHTHIYIITRYRMT